MIVCYCRNVELKNQLDIVVGELEEMKLARERQAQMVCYHFAILIHVLIKFTY